MLCGVQNDVIGINCMVELKWINKLEGVGKKITLENNRARDRKQLQKWKYREDKVYM